MVFSTLDDCSAGEGAFVPSGLHLLPCILLCIKLLRRKRMELASRRRLPQQSTYNDVSAQSQLSLRSQDDQTRKGHRFLIIYYRQQSHLLLPDCETTHYFLSILVVLPPEQQSVSLQSVSLQSDMQTNVHICYWAWKSLGTLCEACAPHILFVYSVSGLNASYKICKGIVSSSVIYCQKISQSNTLFMYTSAMFLSKTFVLVLHLIQRCQIPHSIATTCQLKFQVLFQTVHILVVTVLLCTQLFMMAIHQFIKYAASNGTAIVLIVICSIPLSQAHPTQNGITHDSSSAQHHTRGNGVASTTLNLRLTGGPNVGYCVTVAMGSVPQELCMLVDTGSANFAVAGSSQDGIDEWFHTASSSMYMEMGTSINVKYTSGEWSGTLSKDMVSLGNTAPFEVYFAVIESSKNFFIDQATWVGILGLGYSSLAKPNPSKSPPVWDTFRSLTGMQDVFSLQLCPPLDILVAGGTSLQGGWMVLGGVNHSMYEGDIFNTSIVEEKFYNVLVTNLTVGNTRINMPCSEFNNDKAIIDSGTTDIFLPKPVYEQVETAFKAHFADGMPLEVPDTFWSGQSKLMWQAQHKDEIYSSFPTFHIGFSSNEDSTEGFSLAVTPQTYLRQISGTGGEISATNITCSPCDFFTFGIKSRAQGTVIGSNMMLGFYTIFDRKNRKMGFARSKCSYHSENTAISYIEGPYPRDPVNCLYTPPQDMWEQASFICAGIALPLGIITLVVAVVLRCRSRLVPVFLRCCSCLGLRKHKHYKVLNNTDENSGQNDINISNQEAANTEPESNTSAGATKTVKEATKMVTTAEDEENITTPVDEAKSGKMITTPVDEVTNKNMVTTLVNKGTCGNLVITTLDKATFGKMVTTTLDKALNANTAIHAVDEGVHTDNEDSTMEMVTGRVETSKVCSGNEESPTDDGYYSLSPYVVDYHISHKS